MPARDRQVFLQYQFPRAACHVSVKCHMCQANGVRTLQLSCDSSVPHAGTLRPWYYVQYLLDSLDTVLR